MRLCGGVWGCRVSPGPSSIASEVTSTKTAGAKMGQDEGRAHGSPDLGSDVLERFQGGARWRIRTGPRPELLEKSSASSSLLLWRQLFESTCSTALCQRWDEAGRGC